MKEFFRKIIENNNGQLSSKRLAGIVLVLIGIIMSIDLYLVSRNAGAADPQTSITIIKFMFIAGSSLLGLGLGILEKLKK